MHVATDSLESELRLAIEAVIDLSNFGADDGGDDEGTDDTELDGLREILVRHRYSGAAGATGGDLADVLDRMGPIGALVRSLPELGLDRAVEAVNALLAHQRVEPSIQTHDGSPIHIHWTARSAPFADQVVTDVLMAMVHTLCDTGVARFGRCGAHDCDARFFDTTRNHSRRFCSDPKCASRTHTAEHRARQKTV